MNIHSSKDVENPFDVGNDDNIQDPFAEKNVHSYKEVENSFGGDFYGGFYRSKEEVRKGDDIQKMDQNMTQEMKMKRSSDDDDFNFFEKSVKNTDSPQKIETNKNNLRNPFEDYENQR